MESDSEPAQLPAGKIQLEHKAGLGCRPSELRVRSRIMTSPLDKAIEQFNPSNRVGFEELKLEDEDIDLSAMDHPDTADSYDDEDDVGNMVELSRLDGEPEGESSYQNASKF